MHRARSFRIATTTGLILATFTAAAATENTERAEAAITAFTDAAVAVGFVVVGPGPEGDVLGLAPIENSFDELHSTNQCLGPLGELVEEDGRFAGETARATSDSMELTAEASDTALAPFDAISAVVAMVDDGTAAAIVTTFRADDFLSCMRTAFDASVVDAEQSAGDYEISSRRLDVGNEATELIISNEAEIGDELYTFATTVAIAHVDGALAIVILDSNGTSADEFSAADALKTMATAFEGQPTAS